MERGEIYRLTHQGREYRLMCGDASQKAEVEALFGWEIPPGLCIVTDPPYASTPLRRKQGGGIAPARNGKRPVRGDNLDETVYSQLLTKAIEIPDPDGVMVFTDFRMLPLVISTIQLAGYAHTSEVVWVKSDKLGLRSHAGMGKGFRNAHDDVEVFQKVFYGRQTSGPNDWGRSDVIIAPRVPYSKKVHPYEKPVCVMEQLLSVVQGYPVYDPFCGSGSTLIAANNIGIECAYGMEIDPVHAATAIERWPGKVEKIDLGERATCRLLYRMGWRQAAIARYLGRSKTWVCYALNGRAT